MKFEICNNFVINVENNSLLYDDKLFDVNKISFVGYHEHGFYIMDTNNHCILNQSYEQKKELYRFIEYMNFHILNNYKLKIEKDIIVDFIDYKYDVIFHDNNKYYVSILDYRRRKKITSIDLLYIAHKENKHIRIINMHLENGFVIVNDKNGNKEMFECFNDVSMTKIKDIINKVNV